MRTLDKKSGAVHFASLILALCLLTSCSMEPSEQITGISGTAACADSLNNSNLDPKANPRYTGLNATPSKPPAKPVAMSSGLVYQDIEEGFGISPSLDHLVLVHLTGYLEDGSRFESSRDKGIPLSITLGHRETISGIEQGIMGMKVGGRRKLTIPPSLAYGAKGRSKVPPNAKLTYEVELLSSDR